MSKEDAPILCLASWYPNELDAYEGDFIDYEDVPESKKVRLSYHALYMHCAECCGGGFVYWKNGQFNWLQQE